MFPDYQTRAYRNHADIKWEGKVHERIVGYKNMAFLTFGYRTNAAAIAMIEIRPIDAFRFAYAFDMSTPRGHAKSGLTDVVPSGFHWARWPRMI